MIDAKSNDLVCEDWKYVYLEPVDQQGFTCFYVIFVIFFWSYLTLSAIRSMICHWARDQISAALIWSALSDQPCISAGAYGR